MGSRFLEVEHERLPGWVERYTAARDGAVRCEVTTSGLRLVGDDGSWAQLALLRHGDAWPAAGVERLDPVMAAGVLARVAAAPGPLAVALVRRGGWAVGVLDDARVVAAATGRRRVQGKTAAGGWSQQRYARRRSGQAGKLAGDAQAGVDRVVGQVGARGAGLVAVVQGGDPALVDEVLRGGPWEGLPRLGPVAVGDPRRADVDAMARRVLALRVTAHDAP